MMWFRIIVVIPIILLLILADQPAWTQQDRKVPGLLNLNPLHISTDKSVKFDYDIVYVRLLRGAHKPKVWAQAGVPLQMNPGADLMLLHPDGSEEVLVPGGKVIFSSNRNGFISPRPTNNGFHVNMQLFVMDDDGSNLEMIGHLNIGAALHPVVLRDGRVMFSTLENQGQRDTLSWGLWSIHPDGTNWNPIINSFISTAFHFQTQLSDGNLVVGAYYGGVRTQGFCTYVKVPGEWAADGPRFGSAYREDPRNGPAYPPDLPNRQRTRLVRLPFSPLGMQQLTCFADDGDDTAARLSKDGPWVGKVTHPSAAPDNHLLTIWNAHPTGDHDVDAGIYLLKSGEPIHEPGQMLLIKHDPKYDAQWPRALVLSADSWREGASHAPTTGQ